MASEACLLKMVTAFIMLLRVPPVIFDVSVYLKSALAGTVPSTRSTHKTTAIIAFISKPPFANDTRWRNLGPAGLGETGRVPIRLVLNKIRSNQKKKRKF